MPVLSHNQPRRNSGHVARNATQAKHPDLYRKILQRHTDTWYSSPYAFSRASVGTTTLDLRDENPFNGGRVAVDPGDLKSITKSGHTTVESNGDFSRITTALATPSGDMTFFLWVAKYQDTATSAVQYAAASQAASNNGGRLVRWRRDVANDPMEFEVISSGGTSDARINASFWDDGNPHLFVASVDGDTCRLRLDGGKQTNLVPITGTTTTVISNLGLLNRPDSPSATNRLLDALVYEFGMFPGTLSLGQEQLLYELGPGGLTARADRAIPYAASAATDDLRPLRPFSLGYF